MSQITLQNLRFTYDGTDIPVFQGLNLQLDTNWKIGLVGRNGRGKTTLLRLLEGSLKGQGAISRSEPCRYFPRPVYDPGRPTLQVLREAAPAAEGWRLIRELSRLGLKETTLERPFSSLSGGEQTRGLLAALFLADIGWPMLDEPTNHLDGPGRELVSKYLRSLNRGFLLVSHDRAFLDGCVDHILALNPSGPELMQGNFSTWFQEKEARDRRERARNEALKGEIKRLWQAGQRTAGWSDQVERTKYGVKNAGLRPDRGFIGHKSAKMMKRAKQIGARRERAIQEKAELLKDSEHADPLKIKPALPFSQRLVEGKNLSIFHDKRTICKEISFIINCGDRICLSGDNGAGKTSLLRLILGEAVTYTGELTRASGLSVSYVPQTADHLQGTLSEWAEKQAVDLTQFLTVLRKLDVPRDLFERDMKNYSAGQKKKVLIAASLCQSAHLYIWDEPLNYIDLFSRIQLEELLLEYRPTLLFVEHDKVFRERIATQTLRLPGA